MKRIHSSIIHQSGRDALRASDERVMLSADTSITSQALKKNELGIKMAARHHIGLFIHQQRFPEHVELLLNSLWAPRPRLFSVGPEAPPLLCGPRGPASSLWAEAPPLLCGPRGPASSLWAEAPPPLSPSRAPTPIFPAGERRSFCAVNLGLQK